MNAEHIKLSLPTDEAHIKALRQNDLVFLSGTVYTARDQAHKRIAAAIKSGEALPFDLNNAAIYYCGPTPAVRGEIIGSCGPTTSGRMDAYTPLLVERGLRVMIGKGVRSPEVERAIRAHGAVYLSAIGGAAALYKSKVVSCELTAYPDQFALYKSKVVSCELTAYPDLGCEAVYKLTVEDFPAVVSII